MNSSKLGGQEAVGAANPLAAIELLAPAGGREQLEAALRFGADAVYLATDRYGMRARADNFTLESLGDAVAIAHSFGARVHVACNTLMNCEDVTELPAYFEAVEAAGADAFIVGDIGALRLARRHAPSCGVHVSTQFSVMNPEAALAFEELGASRIVLAREMSIAEITRLNEELHKQGSKLELEVFVHGAMCMAYSGRCLISSYLTGNSASKGACTQSCRWGYALEEEMRPGEYFPIEEDDRGSYILNAKDLNMLAHLNELAEAGVSSFKIEGRNKKAFYVASVVNAYRHVMDGGSPADWEPELETFSHRPYSTGFYFGPAHQAPDYDGYSQETMHVATVIDEGAEGVAALDCGSSSVVARCHNRFEEGETLEALQPHGPVIELTVKNLTWLDDTAEDGSIVEIPVGVANRSMGLYRFDAPETIAPGSFLRVRRYRRSARHGA